MSSRSPARVLSLVAIVAFLATSAPATSLLVVITTPPDGWMSATTTVTINGTAAGPAEATRTLNSTADFQNGTFNGTEVTASGTVGIKARNETTVRFFDDFAYGGTTPVTRMHPSWVSQSHPSGWYAANAWRASDQASSLLSGAPSLVANVQQGSASLYWRMTPPSPIVEAQLQFRYAAQINTRVSAYVRADGTGINETLLFTSLSSSRITDTNMSFDLTPYAANGTTLWIRLYAAGDNWGAFDDFTVDVTFRESPDLTPVTFGENFTASSRPLMWFDPDDAWRPSSTGLSPNGPSLTHLVGAVDYDDNASFAFGAATEIGSVNLAFNYSCETNSIFQIFVGPTLAQSSSLLMNTTGGVNFTQYTGNVSSFVTGTGFVIRFRSVYTGSSPYRCSIDDFALTVEIAGNTTGIGKGTFTSEPLDFGGLSRLNTTGYAMDLPPASGSIMELRAGTNATNWTAWQRLSSGAAIPFNDSRFIQFRVALWGALEKGLPNLTSWSVRFFQITAVRVSVDGWNTSTVANFTSAGSALAVNWSAAVGLQPAWNDLRVRVFDATGAFSETNRSYYWDAFPPSAPGTPLGFEPYWNRTTLNWTWASASDTGFGVAEYRVRLGTTGGGADVVANFSVGSSTSFSYSAAVEGKTYYLSVIARDGAQLWGPWSNASAGVFVDLTAPSTAKPSGPAAWVNTPSITWTWPAFADSGSGIQSYFVRIGTVAGGSDVVAGAEVANASFTLAGAADGQRYYASVRARDWANNYGAWSTPSDLLRVDLTAPSPPATPTGPTGFVNTSTGTWSWTAAADNGSGIDHYEFAAGTAPTTGDLQTPVGTGSTSFFLGSLPDGVAVYARVRAVDVAGNVGSWSGDSAPLFVDRTPPGSIILANGPPRWANYTDFLWTWGQAPDDYSGVANYVVRMGRSPMGSDLLSDTQVKDESFTRSGVPEGIAVFLAVWAVDQAGNIGPTLVVGPSEVDESLPPSPLVTVAPPAATNASVLTWGWTPSTDTGSGIAGYEVRMGTSPNGLEIVDWTLTTGSEYALPATISGVTYYFVVRAIDNVGWRSATTVAQAVLVDKEAPGAVEISVSANLTRETEVTISWTAASDTGGSSIDSYELEISQSAPSRIEALARSIFSYSLRGADGVAYSLRVRAVDGADSPGPWSALREVLFDRTPPSVPANLAGSVSGTVVTASWMPSVDMASGVNGYYVTVGTQVGGADISYREFVPTPRYSFTGQQGRTYFVTVIAVDAAGNEASAATSPGTHIPEPARTPGFDGLLSILALTGLGATIASTRERRLPKE